MLFYESGETKYKRVPRNVRLLSDVHISDGQWDSLMIPIGLAFFVESSAEKQNARAVSKPRGPDRIAVIARRLVRYRR